MNWSTCASLLWEESTYASNRDYFFVLLIYLFFNNAVVLGLKKHSVQTLAQTTCTDAELRKSEINKPTFICFLNEVMNLNNYNNATWIQL